MRESGQVMLLFVLLIPILSGMVGMSVDLGSYASDRRALQNAADSIALAAGQALPDAASAQAIATTYADKNNIDPSRVTVTVTGGNVTPTVSVSITRPHKFAFIRMLGVDSSNVSAKASAVKVSFGGSSGIVPWAVTQATVDQAGVDNLVTMKYDAQGQNTGDFGAIRIDGSGAATYTSDVTYGSNSFVCAVTAPHCVAGSCPGSYPNVCAETAPSCDGPECTAEPGNMTGPTKTGVDYRTTHTSSTCDSIDEAFPEVSGVRHLAAACNPWTSGPGACATATSLCSRRVLIIPVVDSFSNGASATSTIQRFALLFLKGYDGTCTGNSCDIDAWFVKADITTNALAGSYDPTALVHFVKLSD
jgi:Flp pilus assembly protein TadG